MNTIPEEKLLSAVIAQAIEDVCLRPIKGANKRYQMDPEANTAYDFLFVQKRNTYLELLNIDVEVFKRRLFEQLLDPKTNKPFEDSNRQNLLISTKKRAFKMNAGLRAKLRLRG